MALKFPDSAVPMGDFPVTTADNIDFLDGESLQYKLDNGTLGGAIAEKMQNDIDKLNGDETKEGSVKKQISDALVDYAKTLTPNLTFWMGTTEEYDALESVTPNAVYIKTDEATIDDTTRSKETTYSSDYIDNHFLTSMATFIISSNDDLLAWSENRVGNDYSFVYIAAGTYTLESGGINLTAAGTKVIDANPYSKLVFKSTKIVNGNYSAAIYYTTRPTTEEYSIRNVILSCTGEAATSANNYPVGFYNCINLSNCYATSVATGTKSYQAAYGYYNCQNLLNCHGASSGVNNGNAYSFASSKYLTNCIADETTFPQTYDSKADIIPYASCSYLINCRAMAKNGYELTRGFFGSNYIVGCVVELTQDASTTITEIAGFSRCSRMMNCLVTITNNSGKTITNLGGFINSTMIDNCTTNAPIYNCSYVFKCNASAYTSSYSDNYSTTCADTSSGGFNHTGVLEWSSNKWQ